MPNLMDGVNKMQTDQLSSQLATFKIITMSNLFSELGQKATNKTTKMYNGIRKCFGASPVKEKEKVGRNDPCPCQSGLKYKKCSGRDWSGDGGLGLVASVLLPVSADM